MLIWLNDPFSHAQERTSLLGFRVFSVGLIRYYFYLSHWRTRYETKHDTVHSHLLALPSKRPGDSKEIDVRQSLCSGQKKFSGKIENIKMRHSRHSNHGSPAFRASVLTVRLSWHTLIMSGQKNSHTQENSFFY